MSCLSHNKKKRITINNTAQLGKLKNLLIKMLLHDNDVNVQRCFARIQQFYLHCVHLFRRQIETLESAESVTRISRIPKIPNS